MNRNKLDILPLPQADPRNRSNVYKCPHSFNAEERVVYGGTGKPVRACIAEKAMERLVRFNTEHYILSTYIGAKQFEEVAQLEVSSETDLVERSFLILNQALEPAYEDPVIPYGHKKEIRHASLAGCGVTVAFLDVIARVQAQESSDLFDENTFRQVAMQSYSTVPRFIAATSEDADSVLTASMANWSRDQIGRLKEEDKEYFGLLFDRTFFHMSNGSVLLRADEETRKRVKRAGIELFDFSPNKNNVIMGCPFTPYLRELWEAMIEAMIENGFAGEAHERSLETRLHGPASDGWRWTA